MCDKLHALSNLRTSHAVYSTSFPPPVVLQTGLSRTTKLVLRSLCFAVRTGNGIRAAMATVVRRGLNNEELPLLKGVRGTRPTPQEQGIKRPHPTAWVMRRARQIPITPTRLVLQQTLEKVNRGPTGPRLRRSNFYSRRIRLISCMLGDPISCRTRSARITGGHRIVLSAIPQLLLPQTAPINSCPDNCESIFTSF